MALLTVAFARVTSRLRQWVRAARASLPAGGVGYSAYLTGLQFTVLDHLCGLCLVSAGIATSLFLVEGAALLQGKGRDMPGSWKEMRPFFLRGAAALFLLGAAGAAFFQAGDIMAEGGTAAAGTTGREEARCRLAASKTPIAKDGDILASSNDLSVGPEEAKVTVVEYFDPNCSHCQSLHPKMEEIVATCRDEVRFVYKPFPPARRSLPEVAALHLAADSGKFKPVLNARYEPIFNTLLAAQRDSDIWC